MTITYAVNSTTIHGVESAWQRIPLRENPDGTITHSDWALNLWSVGAAGAAAFEALNLAQGDTLTALDTNDIDDRDAAAQYTTVVLASVDGYRHEGLFMRGLRVAFRVKVT